MADRLSRALALGERGRGERQDPHFALASESPDRALDLIFVDAGQPGTFDHLGLFRRRELAEHVARVLREDGELPIYAVPVWLEFAGVALAKRLGRTPEEGELFIVDRNTEPARRVDAALAHGLRVRQGYTAELSHGEAAAQLAASLTPRRIVKRSK